MNDQSPNSFGRLLRFHRRKCSDPLRGGLLTQERLGELLGEELGDRGYSGAAVSDWERDRSKIHKDDRSVLIALIRVLNQSGGLSTAEEANELLLLGNYRALDMNEIQQTFGAFAADVNTTSSTKYGARQAIEEEGFTTKDDVPPLKLSSDRQIQLVLLEKVKNFWLEGVLEQSVDNDFLIDLALRSTHEPINHPWRDVLGRTFLTSKPTTGEGIVSLYVEVDRALLILGEPGAGKTILLISLARELIKKVKRYPNEPIPVILNLASWVQRRSTLLEWVALELTAKYQIPRRLAKKWLLENELVLLLDGLDEVPERFRGLCIQRINEFRVSSGLTGIVVSCRSEEYAATGTPLQLNGATIIQPLSSQQIEDYLDASSFRGNAVKEAIKGEPELQKMAQAPLMLNMMLRSFDKNNGEQSGMIDNARSSGTINANIFQNHLFDIYVRRMFDRRAASKTYSTHQTIIWLNWLAREMFTHNRSVFLIEQIQPDWLPSRKWRWIYMLLSGFILGFVAGIIVWLFWQILRFSSPLMPAPMSSSVLQLLQITEGRADFVALLVSNIILGLIVAVIQARYFETLRLLQIEQESRGFRYAKHLASVGLVVALITAMMMTLVGVPQLALIWSAAEVVVYVIAARYIFGRNYQNEIRTVEALGWSWSSALNGLIIGLVLAGLAEILGLLVYEAPVNLQSTWILGSAGIILGGMQGRRVDKKSYANQGIILSLRNSLIAASVSSFILGVITFYLRDTSYALVAAALTFIIGGSLLGGNNVVKHILVRGILWRQGHIPWRYAQFLDHAVRLAFLQKVGGGYIFIHQLLQEYFANFPEDIVISSGEKSSSQLSPKYVRTNQGRMVA